VLKLLTFGELWFILVGKMIIELRTQTGYYTAQVANSIAGKLQAEGYVVSLRKQDNLDMYKVIARKNIDIDCDL